uniref:Fibrillin-3-like n=1 Tax=Saccoglossus kowalevskii TaxID=10224 RepID=A0ABM0MEV2_SACKO|nr:PREDICTED: fibrillin-3-like [Saccoglossus kowalevskii]
MFYNMYRITDVNECATDNGGCDQICENTEGSFLCHCYPGYLLHADGYTCSLVVTWRHDGRCGPHHTLPDSSPGECDPTGADPCCGPNGHCGHGNQYCQCGTCFDYRVDECDVDNGGCEHICEDTPSSYECHCYPGYYLDDDDHSCVALWLENKRCGPLHPLPNGDPAECDPQNPYHHCCGPNGLCGHGSYYCSCEDCVDYSGLINECLDDNGGCEHICHDTHDSYVCQCNPGYTINPDGYSCDDDNECQDNNGDCAQICYNTDGSYVCDCEHGYVLEEDGHNCTDVNECLQENGGCNHNCHNLPGSYYCWCEDGYSMNYDNHTCEDIDECEDDNGGCDQICTNTDGSYACSCYDGYMLQLDGETCLDINECDEYDGGCAHACINTIGSYECICRPGYFLSNDGHRCLPYWREDYRCGDNYTLENGEPAGCDPLSSSYHCCSDEGYCGHGYEHCYCPDCIDYSDINECLNNNGGCEQICENTQGSYVCHCHPGYGLANDGHSCFALWRADKHCGPPWPLPDGNPSECNPDSAHGHCCGPDNHCGHGPNSCHCETCIDYRDVNECDVENGGCDHVCINTHGSYFCECHFGYFLQLDGHTCRSGRPWRHDKHCGPLYPMPNGDPAECSPHSSHNHCCGPDGHCGHGPAYCECPSCIDYRRHEHEYECDNENGGCEHICNDRYHSHDCECHIGYTLNADNHTCDDINECDEENGGCEYECVNTIGSYYCVCEDGFILGEDHHSCVDENECLDDNAGCEHLCNNTYGSYNCGCNDGYELSEDDHSCDDVDECDEEIDECEATCSNTEGSYDCGCHEGFELNEDGHTCNDTNECDEGSDDCEQICVNTYGSYECDCNDGYTENEDDRSCDDVNECDEENGECEHICVNYDGTYACDCRPGFILDDNNRTCSRSWRRDQRCGEEYLLPSGDPGQCNPLHPNRHCCNRDRGVCGRGRQYCDCENCTDYRDYGEECAVNNGGCDQVCLNTLHSYVCYCSAGYSLNNDQHACDDIDECAINNGFCDHTCTNSIGSYSCSCDSGYTLNLGRFCIDINECDVENGGCEEICVNTDGSHYCDCVEDHVLQPDGVTCEHPDDE